MTLFRRVTALLAFMLLAASALSAEPRDMGAQGLRLYRGGDFAGAAKAFEAALDRAQAERGPNDPSLALELNNLAEAYRMLGRYDRAEALLRRAIELDQSAEPDPRGLATSLNNLSLLYLAQGRRAAAERLSIRALSLLEDSVGPRHPDVARSLNNLAAVYRADGHPERAKPLLERALAVALATLGRGDETTSAIRRGIAGLATRREPFQRVPVAKPRAAALAFELRVCPRPEGPNEICGRTVR